jgi:hypothetical protein
MQKSLPKLIILVASLCLCYYVLGSPKAVRRPIKGCQYTLIEEVKSPPNTALIARVYDERCENVGTFVSISKANESGFDDDVLDMDTDGKPERLPTLSWTGANSLKIVLPNISLIGKRKEDSHGVHITYQFKPNDPAARRAWLEKTHPVPGAKINWKNYNLPPE